MASPKMKLTLMIELEYDGDILHGKDPEAVQWFYETVLKGDDLTIYSDYIGDTIGKIKVCEVLNET